MHCALDSLDFPVLFFSHFSLFLLDESGCFFDRCSLERLLVDLFPLHIYRYFYSVIVLSDVLVCFNETVHVVLPPLLLSIESFQFIHSQMSLSTI